MIIKALMERMPNSFACSIITLLACICCIVEAKAQNIGSFEFATWDGPALNIHYVEPEGVSNDAPIVIVMHGVRRNADEYRDNWIALAEQYGFVVYAPEFDAKRFPQSQSYNLGAIGTDEPSAFAAIEPLFDAIRARRNAPQSTYAIFGHSAGAQFVHRFVLLTKDTRFSLAITANAGWYTMPDMHVKWPYGLKDVDPELVDLPSAFQKPLMIMLGEKDNDPYAQNLRKTSETNAQGSHRFARGASFIRSSKNVSKKMDTFLKWRYRIVKGAGHDNAAMASAAAPLIAAAEKRDQE